jgi:hypothetical protein
MGHSPVVNTRRGFSKLLAPEIARKYHERLVGAALKREPPKTIYDVYDMLPPGPDFPVPVRPYHLDVPIQMLQDACVKETRFCLHTPPRHGKSLMIRVALMYYHFNYPGRFHVYITYNQGKANDVKGDVAMLLRELGISFRSFDDTLLIEGGATAGGTTIKFTSVTRALTGYTVSGVAFVDDPVSGDDKAQSLIMREKVWNFVTKDLLSRKMTFLSVIAVMTRWHVDDVVGRLIDIGFPYVKLPMICDDPNNDLNHRKAGEPLWPEMNDKQKCNEIRMDVGDKAWDALYQGDPFPEAERVFTNNPVSYEAKPQGSYTYSLGLDAGYGGNKNNDWSVAVRLAKSQETGLVYVDRVVRRQCRFDVFIPDLIMLHSEIPCGITWIYGGTEQGAADLLSSDLMKKRLPKINMVFAGASKYYRALDCAAAWNEGMLVVPNKRDNHMASLILNVSTFTGQGDPHDDDVDALVSAFEPFKNPINKRRWNQPVLPGMDPRNSKANSWLSRNRVSQRNGKLDRKV